MDLQTSWARVGASVRLAELQAEREAILQMFPDIASTVVVNTSKVPKRRRTYKMSPAQRRAVGRRMKRYWAEKRKAAKKTA